MRLQKDSFIERALRGEVMFDEIDDFVEGWHESSVDVDLSTHLGMTPDEYSLWVSEPTSIGLILAARTENRSLSDAVNDNYADLERLAARSDRADKLQRLKRWLEAQEGLGH